MKVTISKAQSRALNDLRGLPAGAHMMVMTAERTDTGEILDGTEEAFGELVSFIDEELSEGLASRGAIGPLRSLAIKIDPDCADWLGS